MACPEGESPEVHIAGFVVRAYPAATDAVTGALRRMPGVVVHAGTFDGKIVATIEAPSAGAVADSLCRIQTLDGVLAAALVYQHIETVAEMDQEVDIEDHPT